MTSEELKKDVRSPKAGGSGRVPSLDAVAVELATGLSLADFEALHANPSAMVRAEIAVKFAHEFDRLATGQATKLTRDLLIVFAKDRESLVRRRFAERMKTSPYLPPAIAARLARDEIDVATPILRESPVLAEGVIGEIIKTTPETYALVIAERRPLAAPLVDLLIEHRGTKRVVARLLDNDAADLSDEALLSLRRWGQSDPDIADRLENRPNLPFAFVNQSVIEIADSVGWSSLGDRTMTKYEATQLLDQMEGRSGYRCSSTSERFHRLYRTLKDAYERGTLKPLTLLAFLRDRDIDRLECGLTVMTGLDLRSVRGLLHGGDRRGLVALCLKAEFSTADYLAFRMALGLAELGTASEGPRQRYSDKAMKFARDQFEKMRAEPHSLKRWLPPDAG